MVPTALEGQFGPTGVGLAIRLEIHDLNGREAADLIRSDPPLHSVNRPLYYSAGVLSTRFSRRTLSKSVPGRFGCRGTKWGDTIWADGERRSILKSVYVREHRRREAASCGRRRLRGEAAGSLVPLESKRGYRWNVKRLPTPGQLGFIRIKSFAGPHATSAKRTANPRPAALLPRNV